MKDEERLTHKAGGPDCPPRDEDGIWEAILRHSVLRYRWPDQQPSLYFVSVDGKDLETHDLAKLQDRFQGEGVRFRKLSESVIVLHLDPVGRVYRADRNTGERGAVIDFWSFEWHTPTEVSIVWGLVWVEFTLRYCDGRWEVTDTRKNFGENFIS